MKFNALSHFFGYEGRACLPSNFDANYCYSLGRGASYLIAGGYTGYMCCITNLTSIADEWGVMGLPITSFMTIEKRKGKDKPVIKKALVDLDSKAFGELGKNREKWAREDDYVYPGPIQYFGEDDLVDSTPLTI